MLPADGMIGTGDRVLDVTEQRVDPVELRVRHAGTPTAGDMALMNVGSRIEGSKASEAVADHLTTRCNGLLSIATHLGQGHAAHPARLISLRVAIFIGLHGGDKRELVLSAAPALSRPLTAQVGVIDLDTPGEPFSLVALVHDLQELVLELPGGVVGDAELPGQLQCREAALALGQQIDSQKPGGQWQVRTMENGAGSHRGLMMAAMTLIEPPRQPAAGVIATVGAHKPSGPAVLEEGGLAFGFCVVLLEKRRQRQAGLELDGIACHDVTSCTGYNYSVEQADQNG